MTLKLGSLFDGAGGFPFAAQLNGIEPIWASEIEPFPIAVTHKRIPHMKHLGDVSKVNGAEVEPVDILSFGSPCQDLSVAGKGAGMKHTENGDDETTRSGLFMEAIRIIKEMRSATNGEYPKVCIWENVPGAYSSSGGEDFRTVLKSFINICDETADIPRPPKGKWANAGEIVGDGFSLAWRTLDAQYFGVAQRRRRCFLVFCPGSECASEILFKRGGLSRNFAESRAAWKGITKSLAFCSPAIQRADRQAAEDSSAEMGIIAHGEYGICSADSNAMKSANPNSGFYEADTSRCLDANGGNPSCNQGGIAIVSIEGKGSRPSHQGDGYSEDGVSYTLNSVERHAVCAWTVNQREELRDLGEQATALSAEQGTHQQTYLAVFSKGTRPHNEEEAQKWHESDVANTLNCNDIGECRANELVFAVENHSQDSRVGLNEDGRSQALTSQCGTGGNNVPMVLGIGAFHPRESEKTRGIAWDEDTSPTLSSTGATPAIVMGVDGYNASVSDESPTLGVNCGMSSGRNGVMCLLNDQGGSVMQMEEGDTSPTIRSQMKHHEPVVMTAELGVASRDGGHVYEDVAGTLRAEPGDNRMSVLCVRERAGCEGGGKGLLVQDGVSGTIPAHADQFLAYVIGNGQADLIGLTQISGALDCMHDPKAVLVGRVINLNKDDYQSKTILSPEGISPALYSGESRFGGGELYILVVDDAPKAYGIDQQGGKGGANYTKDVSPTLCSDSHGTPHGTCYVLATQQGGAEIGEDLCPTITASAGMSGNNQPVTTFAVDMAGGKSACQVTEDKTSTLACTHYGEPVTVYAVDARNSVIDEKNGTLQAKSNGGISYNTNNVALCVALDRSAYNQGQNAQFDMGVDESGKAYTVTARGPGATCYLQLTPVEIVLRRLTPTECARLQGMPDWWCDDLAIAEPTEEDMAFWREVFETYRQAIDSNKKPKTDAQIRKWLANPLSDSAMYKMWGNGMALPCVMYVMEGVSQELQKESLAEFF